MYRINIIDARGTLHELEGADGQNIMAVAVDHDVPGIVGECGGDMSCGTCHVHIEDTWQQAAGQPDADETDMLEVVDNLQPNSRLCCQIRMSSSLDGITLKVAGTE